MLVVREDGNRELEQKTKELTKQVALHDEENKAQYAMRLAEVKTEYEEFRMTALAQLSDAQRTVVLHEGREHELEAMVANSGIPHDLKRTLEVTQAEHAKTELRVERLLCENKEMSQHAERLTSEMHESNRDASTGRNLEAQMLRVQLDSQREKSQQEIAELKAKNNVLEVKLHRTVETEKSLRETRLDALRAEADQAHGNANHT